MKKIAVKAADTGCELKSEVCLGKMTAMFEGTKKGDPQFRACLACVAWYKRKGVSMRQVRKTR